MPKTTDPIRPTDDDARTLARRLLADARHGALGVIEPGTGLPLVTRVAVTLAEPGAPMTLISDLSMHTGALRANPRFSLLLGEPGARGDPLTHPRITLQGHARFIGRPGDDHSAARDIWLSSHPKSTLYIDFADFNLVHLSPDVAHLNGGFGKAYRLGPDDLKHPG